MWTSIYYSMRKNKYWFFFEDSNNFALIAPSFEKIAQCSRRTVGQRRLWWCLISRPISNQLTSRSRVILWLIGGLIFRHRSKGNHQGLINKWWERSFNWLFEEFEKGKVACVVLAGIWGMGGYFMKVIYKGWTWRSTKGSEADTQSPNARS